MSTSRLDVVAIGNAIVDIIGRCDDAFLAKHGAPKSHMRLVDAKTIETIYADMGPAVEISGGSAANTAVGLASIGGRAGFIGKIASDEFGRIFSHDIRAAGVTFRQQAVPGRAPTSRSLILVTPDGERTMNTFLGISTEFDHAEVDEALIRMADIVYLEGYLFDRTESKDAFRHIAGIAKSGGARVALTLSDSFCVDRHRADFLSFIRNDVDILLANESEIMSLYETGSFDNAARRTAADVRLAALTRSAKGSVILSRDTVTAIPVEPVAKVVDTTGAGDLYAAGFLYGISAGLPNEKAARLGSLAATEVISHIGARPEANLAILARQHGLLK